MTATSKLPVIRGGWTNRPGPSAPHNHPDEEPKPQPLANAETLNLKAA